jgi:hypothetical protein
VSNEAYIHGGVPVIHSQRYFCDFITAPSATSCYPNYFGGTVGTAGNFNSNNGAVVRPGVTSLQRGTGANSGYYYTISGTSLLLAGNETFSIGLGNYQAPAGTNITWYRVGFLDTVTAADSTDGVYFQYWINATASSGRCVAYNNGALLGSDVANFTLPLASWYEMKIDINSAGTAANCSIWNATTGALYWSANLSANLPTGAGRYTGAGIMIYESAAGSAANRVDVDYLNTEIQAKRRLFV